MAFSNRWGRQDADGGANELTAGTIYQRGEIAKWRHAQEAWDNLQIGLRLGARPRTMVKTTPRALPLLRRLVGTSVVTRGRMAAGAGAVASVVAEAVLRRRPAPSCVFVELDPG